MNWLRFDFVFENSRHEKRLWFMTLLLGTCMLYSTRTSMPLLTPAVSSELRWSKTESGTVLSSFFWGYTVTQVRLHLAASGQFTWRFCLLLLLLLQLFIWSISRLQVLGGYFSDRFGGQRVIFGAAIGWSLITFWMPDLLTMTSRQWHYNIPFIVTMRILNGALQGVHFPSMISITSQVESIRRCIWFWIFRILFLTFFSLLLLVFKFKWTIEFF